MNYKMNIMERDKLLLFVYLFLTSYFSLVIDLQWAIYISFILIIPIFYINKNYKIVYGLGIVCWTSNLVLRRFQLEFSGWFQFGSEEMSIVIARLLIVTYVILLSTLFLICKKKVFDFKWQGNFKSTIHLPFIWTGKKVITVLKFVLVASISNLTVFLFMINYSVLSDRFFNIISAALVFALVNSFLEEVIWRGMILPKTISFFGEKQGLVISSVMFGLYHYSFGIPWPACIAFIFAGLYMGGLVIRSGGLLPVWLFHFTLNLGMFLSFNTH